MSLARNTVIKRAVDGKDHDSPLNQLLPLLPYLLGLLSDRQDQKDPSTAERSCLLYTIKQYYTQGRVFALETHW